MGRSIHASSARSRPATGRPPESADAEAPNIPRRKHRARTSCFLLVAEKRLERSVIDDAVIATKTLDDRLRSLLDAARDILGYRRAVGQVAQNQLLIGEQLCVGGRFVDG